MTLGQQAIFRLGAEHRGRLNGLYMATFFTGGAIGSALGGLLYTRGGWALTSCAGLALPVIALACFATERAPDQSLPLPGPTTG
jgi:predicted MFS family arabinose efflux permease